MFDEEELEEMERHMVQVKVLTTYPSPHDPRRKETAWHQFFDYSPMMEATADAIESYKSVPGVEIKIWYEDVPELAEDRKPTHETHMTPQ